MSEKKSSRDIRHKILIVVGIVLCVVLALMLVVNLTLIIKGAAKREEVPMFFGYFPMIVQTDSMRGVFDGGDLTINRKVAADKVEEGDIIVFFDPDSNGTNTVTHRVVEVIDDGDGTRSFLTKGDANNTPDTPVGEEKLIGQYCFRLAKMGYVALFMQSTAGLIVCVLLPLVALVVYEIIRRRLYDKKKQAEQEKLRAELEQLKAEKEKAEQAEK